MPRLNAQGFCGHSLAVFLLPLLMSLGALGCHPKYPKCETDKDCRDREYCVKGQCQQCRDDRDCDGGTCKEGRCEKKSSMSVRCSDDLQCPAGQSCIDGACKPCKDDAECGEGGKCNQGRCSRASSSSTGDNNGSGGCRFEPVYFDFNESVLSTEATTAIDHNAECIKKQNTRSITLTGHSDPRGTEEYNYALSDRRAQSVRDRFQRLGASPSTKLVPKGELEATGTEEAGWAKDRRVDVN